MLPLSTIHVRVIVGSSRLPSRPPRLSSSVCRLESADRQAAVPPAFQEAMSDLEAMEEQQAGPDAVFEAAATELLAAKTLGQEPEQGWVSLQSCIPSLWLRLPRWPSPPPLAAVGLRHSLFCTAADQHLS